MTPFAEMLTGGLLTKGAVQLFKGVAVAAGMSFIPFLDVAVADVIIS